MRNWLCMVMVLVLCVLWGRGAFAVELAVTAGIGPGYPVGDFGKTVGIVGADQSGTYSATGGGAESNFGFQLGLEAQVNPRVFVGGMFGYRRYNVQADDVLNEVIKPLLPEAVRLDANWRNILFGAYVRADAYSTQTWRAYSRAGLGVASMKNSFDVDFGTSDITTRTATTDFDVGNRLYIAGCIGTEYALASYVNLFLELDFHQFFTDGAEASASIDEYTIRERQKFNTQILGVMFGVKIPFNAL